MSAISDYYISKYEDKVDTLAERTGRKFDDLWTAWIARILTGNANWWRFVADVYSGQI